MKIHHLKPAPGAHRPKRRKGRGEAAGKGKTAGRGQKGTGARGSVSAGFEGGQLPLQQRLPQRPGFTPRNRVEFATVNVERLDGAFAAGDAVTPDTLRAKGLIRRGTDPVKILGAGELTKPLRVWAHAFSGTAKEKISQAGGETDVLTRTRTLSQ
ncbi:MAG: 50S ribosomal protein L15 [Egibacteraceae bacterium]